MDSLLKIALSAAVPLLIQQRIERGGPRQEDFDNLRAKNIPKLLGEKADILLFGSKKKGETAYIFNEVADAIAMLSFLPGGIDIFGSHWENKADSQLLHMTSETILPTELLKMLGCL